MKDYTHGKDEDFILNYEVKNDKIIIKFADKKLSKMVIDYTEENEKKILDKMLKQTKGIDKTKMEEKNNKDSKTTILFALAFIVCFIPMAFGFTPLMITASVSFWFCMKYFNSYIETSDYLKSILFLENEAKINEVIKENKNVVENVSKKTKSIINKNKKFDINSINKMSYHDLKQLLELIKKDGSFGFEQSKEVEKIEDSVNKKLTHRIFNK